MADTLATTQFVYEKPKLVLAVNNRAATPAEVKIDVSAAVAQAGITITHVRLDVPYTSGSNPGREYFVAGQYSWEMACNFVMKGGYGFTGSAGDQARSLNDIIMSQMPVPLGSGNGSMKFELSPVNKAVGSDNPKFSGSVAVDSWAPLGSGEIPSILTMQHTFMGNGALTVEYA